MIFHRYERYVSHSVIQNCCILMHFDVPFLFWTRLHPLSCHQFVPRLCSPVPCQLIEQFVYVRSAVSLSQILLSKSTFSQSELIFFKVLTPTCDFFRSLCEYALYFRLQSRACCNMCAKRKRQPVVACQNECSFTTVWVSRI